MLSLIENLFLDCSGLMPTEKDSIEDLQNEKINEDQMVIISNINSEVDELEHIVSIDPSEVLDHQMKDEAVEEGTEIIQGI